MEPEDDDLTGVSVPADDPVVTGWAGYRRCTPCRGHADRKKYDGRASTACPSIALPAVAPWRRALAQCSTRMCRPRRGLYAWAMSPAAKMSGSEVRRCSSTMPSSTLRPTSAASSARGMAPMPMMTMSASIRVPSLRMTPRSPPPAGQFGRGGPVAQVHTTAAV